MILYSFERKDIVLNQDAKETCKFDADEYNPGGLNISRNRNEVLPVVLTY
jgi:hypothetical protein